MEYERVERGRFALKGESRRSVRSMRLTDATWQLLGKKAQEQEQGITRADYIEALFVVETET